MSTVNINGIDLYYEKSGNKGRKVLLLHGWGQNTQMMAFIASCSMYQLVAITVLYCSFDSLALPYYIIKETMGETACSIDDFMAKLSAYCKREEISIPADMPATISAFCEYWTI